MKIRISKLDAARRQIECAVALYFDEADPISIHTLTGAAYNILIALNNGQTWMIKDQIKNHVIKGKEKEAKALINKAENFFKHADRDPQSTLDFSLDSTEILLWECCSVYPKLTGKNSPTMETFKIWFVAKHNKFFIYTDQEKAKVDEAKAFIETLSKEDFFRLMLEKLTITRIKC